MGAIPPAQTAGMSFRKVCVDMLAQFSSQGGVRPLVLTWTDGRKYTVERVRMVERAPARVNAVLPVRYTCVIGGKEKLIYFEPERMRWFVEVRL